jgi:hypothetical protein
MTLVDVALPLDDHEIPSGVRDFIVEANLRVSSFMEARPKPLVGFFPSCFETVYRALREISNRRLTAGNSFCEWGSGFGVTASMASMLGFDSYGIEIDPELCEVSRELALQFSLSVTFTTGSFIPKGSDKLIDRAYANCEGDMMLIPHTDSSYDEIGMDVRDFDLVFAYPWPKDTKLTNALFDKFASSDALLLTYNGLESVRLQRKRSDSKSSRGIR